MHMGSVLIWNRPRFTTAVSAVRPVGNHQGTRTPGMNSMNTGIQQYRGAYFQKRYTYRDSTR